MDEAARDAIFSLGPHIRYVAFASGQSVDLFQREDLVGASEASSDYFEELLVNPTALTLLRRRGDLDCRGLRFVSVGYGNFNQVLVETGEGHVSVSVELDADPARVAEQVARVIGR